VYFDDAVLEGIAIRSLLDDGDFARAVVKPFTNNWIAAFEKCMKRAAGNGDLR
jgi:hypothetical protein